MRILAIETTEKNGGVATLDDRNTLIELELGQEGRSAQTLATGIKLLLQRVGWQPKGVDLVAVCTGPGSFTGLRVGLTTAKTFAYCTQSELIGVDTLEVIAVAAPDDVTKLSIGMDVQRGEVIVGRFERATNGWFKAMRPSEIVSIKEWFESVEPGTIVTGPILHRLADRIPAGVKTLDPKYWSPTAASVARLAAWQYANGRRDDVFELKPLYSRMAAAEEKWEQSRRKGV